MALTDEAISKIKDMILDGRLKPGDRLPREADLADQLGISRGSLREAVKALSMIRILDVRRGDGTFVTSLQPELLLETLTFVIDFHQDAGILDLFEVRRALEPMAAEKAALLMSETDAADLVSLVNSVTVDDSMETVVDNDLEFHHRIAVASGNAVLCSLADSVANRTHPARLWRGVTQEDSITQTKREHLAIAQAISNRQPSIAAACALAHVAGIEGWIRSNLGLVDAAGDVTARGGAATPPAE